MILLINQCVSQTALSSKPEAPTKPDDFLPKFQRSFLFTYLRFRLSLKFKSSHPDLLPSNNWLQELLVRAAESHYSSTERITSLTSIT